MIVSITTNREEGGLASSLVSYSKAMAPIGEQHLVIIPDTAPVIKTLEKLDNIEVINKRKIVIVFHIFTRFFFSKELKGALRKSHLILVHNARFMRHFKRFEHKLAYINHSGKLRGTVHRAYNIFITTPALKKFLKAYPDNKSKNKVICHGFDISDNISRSSTKLSQSSNKTLNIMSAGRFVEKKGFENLITAASILKKMNSDICIYLYGDGFLRPELEEKTKSLNVENVIFMGWHPDLHKEFNKYDAFCSPSLQEPFGLVIGEAMVNGLPVIATKTDGALEIFKENKKGKTEDHGGILVDISAPEQLAHAMLRLLDASFREQIGTHATSNIQKNYSLKRLSDDLQTLIAETKVN